MHLYVYEESVIQSEKTFTIRLFGLIFDCRESYFFLDKDVAFAQDRDHDSLLVKPWPKRQSLTRTCDQGISP